MSDQIDLSQITPQEFATLVSNSSDEEIETTVRAVGVETVLDRIFAGMQESFKPDAAKGQNFALGFVITDEGTQHPYQVRIADGTCVAERGLPEDARSTISTDVVSFAKLVAGKAQGPQLFMAGRLKVSGDLMFSAQIMNLFDRPSAS